MIYKGACKLNGLMDGTAMETKDHETVESVTSGKLLDALEKADDELSATKMAALEDKKKMVVQDAVHQHARAFSTKPTRSLLWLFSKPRYLPASTAAPPTVPNQEASWSAEYFSMPFLLFSQSRTRLQF